MTLTERNMVLSFYSHQKKEIYLLYLPTHNRKWHCWGKHFDLFAFRFTPNAHLGVQIRVTVSFVSLLFCLSLITQFFFYFVCLKMVCPFSSESPSPKFWYKFSSLYQQTVSQSMKNYETTKLGGGIVRHEKGIKIAFFLLAH